jgi:hypothetical protein
VKVITAKELQNKGEKELTSLFRMATMALTTSKAASAERRNALATLENISRARMALRR